MNNISTAHADTLQLETLDQHNVQLPISALDANSICVSELPAEFEHQQEVVVSFNYVINGELHYVRSRATIHRDGDCGVELRFTNDSELGRVAKQLKKAAVYHDAFLHLSICDAVSRTTLPH